MYYNMCMYIDIIISMYGCIYMSIAIYIYMYMHIHNLRYPNVSCAPYMITHMFLHVYMYIYTYIVYMYINTYRRIVRAKANHENK